MTFYPYLISVSALFVVIYLISKIKKYKDEIKDLKSQLHLKDVLNSLPIPVFIKKDSKIIYTNAVFDQSFGTNKVNIVKELSKLPLEPKNYINLEFDNAIEKNTLIYTKKLPDYSETVGIIFDITEFKTEANVIKEYKERLERTIEGSDGGIWDWDIKTDTVYYSKRWKEIMGYTQEEKVDNINAWINLIDPRDAPLANDGIAKLLRGQEKILDFTYRTHLDSPPKWIQVKAKAHTLNNKVVKISGMIMDITKIKIEEKRLNKSKKLFATFMDNLPAIAFIKDTKNRYIYLNNFYQSYIGFKKWENKTPYELFDKKIADAIIENDRKAFYEGIKKHEEIIPTERGVLKYIESYKFPIEDDEGNRLLCGFGIDKTKEKLYLEKIELYAKIFNNTAEAIMITDKYGKILSVNRAFEETTEYTQQELIGKSPKILHSQKNSEETFNRLKNSLKERGYFSGKIYNKSKSGKILPQFISINSIKDKNGKVSFYFAIYKNINQ